MLSQKPDAKHVWQDFIYIKFKNRQTCQLYLSKAGGWLWKTQANVVLESR